MVDKATRPQPVPAAAEESAQDTGDAGAAAQRRRTLQRLTRTAAFSAARAVGSGLGAAAVTAVVWWCQHH